MHSTTTITDRSSITNRSSPINNQEPKKAHGRIVDVMPLDISYLLGPDEWGYILPYLNEKDIISTAQCFENAQTAIYNDESIMYHATRNAWFSLFTPQQQAAFRRFKKTMSESGIHRWMCQFEAEESITRFLEKKPPIAELFFTRSLSMRNCPIFQIEKLDAIAHDTQIKSTTFSADGLHLVATSYNCTAKIYGQDSSGGWALKTIIDHSPDWIRSAIFSADDSHVITLSNPTGAKIYGQDSNGQWIQKATIHHHPVAGNFDSATFSADSLHAMYVSSTYSQGIVTIFGQDSNGTWTQSARLENHRTNSKVVGHTLAIFSPDSLKVLLINHNKTTQIYEQASSDNTWTKKDTPALDEQARSATFSEDSRHIMITHENNTISIYRQDLDEKWTKQINIKKIASGFASFSIDPIFSNDSRCVMIVRKCHHVAKIYGQNSEGQWEKKTVIKHKHFIQTRSFSPDSRHAVTSSRNRCVQIYSQMPNDQWRHTATSQHKRDLLRTQVHIITPFSIDSHQLLVASTAVKAINVYTWTSNEGWIESHVTDVETGKYFHEATFSADGSHVIIVTTNTVKIYGRETKGNTWKEQAHIHHPQVTTARISADGSYVVTVNYANYYTAKTWRLSLE